MDDIKQPTKCEFCGGTGIIEVPSMLGFGVEVYPCTSCHALGKSKADQLEANTLAWIMTNIR